MIRRCLSLFLILAHAAFQAVASSHAHAAASHGSRGRHFHITSLQSNPGHAHDQASPHREYAGPVDSHALKPQSPTESTAEHDANAVYVPEMTPARKDSSDMSDWPAWGKFVAVVNFFQSGVDSTVGVAASFQSRDGSDTVVEHCALFLKLRTLLI